MLWKLRHYIPIMCPFHILRPRTVYGFLHSAALVMLASVLCVALHHEYFSTEGTHRLFAFGWFYAQRSVQKRERFHESVLKLKSFSDVRGRLDRPAGSFWSGSDGIEFERTAPSVFP
jgi:hypothetical protein